MGARAGPAWRVRGPRDSEAGVWGAEKPQGKRDHDGPLSVQNRHTRAPKMKAHSDEDDDRPTATR